jgi:predicted amidohydrolase
MMMSYENSLQNGGSLIVDPRGRVVSGPLVDEEGVIYCDVDPLLAVEERQNLDISGHYSRFDIFNKPLK